MLLLRRAVGFEQRLLQQLDGLVLVVFKLEEPFHHEPDHAGVRVVLLSDQEQEPVSLFGGELAVFEFEGDDALLDVLCFVTKPHVVSLFEDGHVDLFYLDEQVAYLLQLILDLLDGLQFIVEWVSLFRFEAFRQCRVLLRNERLRFVNCLIFL